MGLFSSIFGGSKIGLVSPKEFYKQCVEAIHEKLKSIGYAKSGVIVVPELVSIGKGAIRKYLQNPHFYDLVKRDKRECYSFASGFVFLCGVVFADKWVNNYAELVRSYKDEVMKEVSVFYGIRILKKAYNESDISVFNEVYDCVFDAWYSLLEPYWEVKNSDQYVLNALLAVHQAGISTVLEKFDH